MLGVGVTADAGVVCSCDERDGGALSDLRWTMFLGLTASSSFTRFA